MTPSVDCVPHTGLIDSLVDCVPHTGLIDSLVANAVADSHTHSLLCSLILARQASLEGTHIYPLYHEWFQVRQSAGCV